MPGTDNSMRPFSLLIKPASARCNLHCDYCFYYDKLSLYQGTSQTVMSRELLDLLTMTYLAQPMPDYNFIWQGGEPLLMGFDFYHEAVRLQNKHGRPGSLVYNSLQTNGILLTEDMAKLCADYGFLVGISIDGPHELHDMYRKYHDGRGSHSDVMRGLELLQKHGVEHNAMVLVSKANVKDPEAVYKYLTGLGIMHHQYVPCVEFDLNGRALPWTITGSEWGKFLKKLFYAWQAQDIYRVSVRNFDAVMLRLMNKDAGICSMAAACDAYFVVEYNGDIYPCDFFVEPQLKLGNIKNMSWLQLQDSPLYRDFACEKQNWSDRCELCGYNFLCCGDCQKCRIHTGDSGRESWLCEGWMDFYDEILAEFEKIISRL